MHKRPLLDRICGWLHTRAILRAGDARLFHMGLLTEWNGRGAVLSLSFLGGAGYIPSPSKRDSCWVRGFTVYVRCRRSTARIHDPYRVTFPWLTVTTNPNRHTVSTPWVTIPTDWN